MDSIQVSKHFKNGQHSGFRKHVFGRMFHLVTGTTPAHEARAKAIAERLVAHAEHLRKVYGVWTDAAVAAAYDVPVMIAQNLISASAAGPSVEVPLPAVTIVESPSTLPALIPPRAPVNVPISVVAHKVMPASVPKESIWLYDAMEMFKQAELLRERINDTGTSNAKNYIFRIEWSKEGITDQPLSELSHVSVLKAWRGHFTARPISKKYGRPISAASASVVSGTIRYFLDWCDIEQLWTPCHRWREAFKGISEKKLKTRVERNKKKREGFFNFTIQEMRFIWHACLAHNRAIVGLALWCGHTQNEIATILLDGEFVEHGGELYLERDRNKTGVYGRWWIPPELAMLVRQQLCKMPRSIKENPHQIAFITGHGEPLVHFAKAGKRTRSDAVAQFWRKTVRLVEHYGVRYHSFKYLRKTMAQQVRDRVGVELATLFSAEVIAGVQDEHYTNASFEKLERCIREDIYPIWKEMFRAFSSEELEAERERITKINGPVVSIDGSLSPSQAAITELNALKSKLPDLNVRVVPLSEDEEPLRKSMILRTFRKPEPEDVEALVAKEKAERELPAAPPQSDIQLTLAQFGLEEGISASERQQYKAKLAFYLEDFRRWAEATNVYYQSFGETFRFRLVISNDGQVPAEDIEVILSLPPVLQLITCENEIIGSMSAEAPRKPVPPEKPVARTPFGLGDLVSRNDYSFADRMNEITNLQTRFDPSFKLAGDAKSGLQIKLHIPKLLHFKHEIFGDFYSMFCTKEKAQPFQASLVMTAANSPVKVERKVPFLFGQQSDPDDASVS